MAGTTITPKAGLGAGLAAVLLLMAAVPGLAADRKTEERLQQLEGRMERIDRVLGNEALLNMQQQLSEMQEQLRTLRGQNEELSHQLEQLRARQRELYLDVDRRLQDVEAGGGGAAPAAAAPAAGATGAAAAAAATPAPAAPPPPPSGPAAGASSQSPAPAASASAGVTGAEEREAYKSAFNQLREGRYEAAIAAFTDFLKTYPDSGYAGNAQYWLGEAYYVSKDYQAAAREFQKVLTTYTNSNKVADARLKLGFTYYELGQWEPARSTLQAVLDKHPGTTVARLADQRLKRMQREGH